MRDQGYGIIFWAQSKLKEDATPTPSSSQLKNILADTGRVASLGQKWPRTPFVFERYAGNGSANKNFAAAENAAAWVARVEKYDTNTEGMAVWKEAELDRAIVVSSMRMKFDSVEISVFHLPQSISATNPQKKNDKHGNVAVSPNEVDRSTGTCAMNFERPIFQELPPNVTKAWWFITPISSETVGKEFDQLISNIHVAEETTLQNFGILVGKTTGRCENYPGMNS